MFGTPYVLDPRQRELMAAFCRRNQETTQIFSKAREGSVNDDACNGRIFPLLFAAALAARRTAPNVLFHGLLSMSNRLLSSHDVKRSRR
jgi:hypothetical protein